MVVDSSAVQRANRPMELTHLGALNAASSRPTNSSVMIVIQMASPLTNSSNIVLIDFKKLLNIAEAFHYKYSVGMS